MAAPPPAARPAASAEHVGRGALYITAAKGVFMLTGAAVSLGLGSLLGARAYGDYGVTIRWVSLLNMMVVQGLLQGLSRAVSAAPASAGVLRDQARWTVAAVSASAALLVLLAAWPLGHLLGDPGLVTPLMVAACIPLAYGFYAAAVGVVNGQQRFRAQALMDMGFSVAKMACILGAAALGLQAAGSVGGFGMAAVVMAGVSTLVVGALPREPPAVPLTWRTLLSFGGWVMAYQAALNLLMFVDLGLVKRAAGLGTLPEDAAGFYAAAVNLAQLPYFGCTAITFVVFPLVGRSVASGDKEASRASVQGALRYALLLSVPLAAALVAAPELILQAIFPAAYAAAAPALRLLALSYVLAAVNAVLCTLLNALGQPVLSAGSTLGGVVVTLAAGLVLVPAWGLVGGAAASAAGMLVSLVAAGLALRSSGVARWPLGTLVRVSVAGAAVVAAAVWIPWPAWQGRGVGVLAGGLAALATVGLLVPLGELGRAEWDLLRRVAGRGRRAETE